MRNHSRNLLFLACHFPPAHGSACVRTWNIAKHLARSGWNVTVLTPDPSIWRTVDDPQGISRNAEREKITRIFTGYRWRCLDPDALKCWNHNLGWVIGGIFRRIARYFAINSGIGWAKEAELACNSLTFNDVDVILVTGPPFAAFSLAKRLAKRFDCPYVLDYRDPWVVHHGATSSAVEATRKLERDLIEDSAAVTVISESLLKGSSVPSSKLHVITNGYDPEELDQVRPYDFGHFAIVYTGVFRPPITAITPVMAALRRLKDKGTTGGIEWKFHYYGPHGEHVHDEAQRFGVQDKIVLHGKVPRAVALSAVRGSDVTVVITSVLEPKAEWEKGIVTGKLFEPLGMHIPILLIGPTGTDVDDIIGRTGLAHKVTASNIEGMVSFIEEVISGKVPPERSPHLYAWPNIMKKLDAVLLNVVGRKSPLVEGEEGGFDASDVNRLRELALEIPDRVACPSDQNIADSR